MRVRRTGVIYGSDFYFNYWVDKAEVCPMALCYRVVGTHEGDGVGRGAAEQMTHSQGFDRLRQFTLSNCRIKQHC